MEERVMEMEESMDWDWEDDYPSAWEYYNSEEEV